VVQEPLWHAIYTRYQHEQIVALHLASRGFNVYFPRHAVVRQWRDRTKHLLQPLFPSYVFVQGGLDRQTQMLSAPGVFAIVGWGGRPASIPRAELDRVLRMVQGPLACEPHVFLRDGERIRMREGPLKGIEGILVRKKNVHRLVISLAILGRSAAVEVDLSSIEMIPGAP
jgi:transcription antitermination factor NusG